MNVEALRLSRQNLSRTFNDLGVVSSCVLDQDGHDMETQDDMPVSLFGLERLPLIKRIHHARKEIADIRGDQELKPFLKEYDSVDTVAHDFLELSRTIMSCLEFFHSSSRILEQALKDPMKQDALPMPHDLHRDAANMFESCMWIIQNKRWQLIDHQVTWEIIIPKLEEEVCNWEAFSKQTGQHLKEVQDLRAKLDIVLQNHKNLLQ